MLEQCACTAPREVHACFRSTAAMYRTIIWSVHQQTHKYAEQYYKEKGKRTCEGWEEERWRGG
jgi:hypothetical protein